MNDLEKHIKNLKKYCEDDRDFRSQTAEEEKSDFDIFCDNHIADIQAVIKELKDTKSDLYEANNKINDLLDIEKQKDKIIQEMIKVIIDSGICDYFIKQHCVHYAGENKKLCNECILEYFEERCK